MATYHWQAQGQQASSLCAAERAVLAQREAAQAPALRVALAFVPFLLERDGQISSSPSEGVPLTRDPAPWSGPSPVPLLHAHLAPRYTLQEDGLG